jgi:hypothetical protein
MFLRKISNVKYLFLCQSADWQCVVEAEDQETAATLAVEKVMLNCKDDGSKFSLAMVIAVQKLTSNLIEETSFLENSIAYYSPTILANAGFHVESKNLHNFLQQQIQEQEDESE